MLHLLVEVGKRESNPQFGAGFVDPKSPADLFMKGVNSLSEANTPEEACSRGIIAVSVLLLWSVSSKDPNTSMTYAGFLLVLC